MIWALRCTLALVSVGFPRTSWLVSVLRAIRTDAPALPLPWKSRHPLERLQHQGESCAIYTRIPWLVYSRLFSFTLLQGQKRLLLINFSPFVLCETLNQRTPQNNTLDYTSSFLLPSGIFVGMKLCGVLLRRLCYFWNFSLVCCWRTRTAGGH